MFLKHHSDNDLSLSLLLSLLLWNNILMLTHLSLSEATAAEPHSDVDHLSLLLWSHILMLTHLSLIYLSLLLWNCTLMLAHLSLIYLSLLLSLLL